VRDLATAIAAHQLRRLGGYHAGALPRLRVPDCCSVLFRPTRATPNRNALLVAAAASRNRNRRRWHHNTAQGFGSGTVGDKRSEHSTECYLLSKVWGWSDDPRNLIEIIKYGLAAPLGRCSNRNRVATGGLHQQTRPRCKAIERQPGQLALVLIVGDSNLRFAGLALHGASAPAEDQAFRASRPRRVFASVIHSGNSLPWARSFPAGLYFRHPLLT
jgi:hypothetical protein